MCCAFQVGPWGFLLSLLELPGFLSLRQRLSPVLSLFLLDCPVPRGCQSAPIEPSHPSPTSLVPCSERNVVAPCTGCWLLSSVCLPEQSLQLRPGWRHMCPPNAGRPLVCKELQVLVHICSVFTVSGSVRHLKFVLPPCTHIKTQHSHPCCLHTISAGCVQGFSLTGLSPVCLASGHCSLPWKTHLWCP